MFTALAACPFVLCLVGNLFVKISPCHIGLVECAMHNAQPAYEAQPVGDHAKEDAAPTKTDPETTSPPLPSPKPAAQVPCRVVSGVCVLSSCSDALRRCLLPSALHTMGCRCSSVAFLPSKQGVGLSSCCLNVLLLILNSNR